MLINCLVTVRELCDHCMNTVYMRNITVFRVLAIARELYDCGMLRYFTVLTVAREYITTVVVLVEVSQSETRDCIA